MIGRTLQTFCDPVVLVSFSVPALPLVKRTAALLRLNSEGEAQRSGVCELYGLLKSRFMSDVLSSVSQRPGLWLQL